MALQTSRHYLYGNEVTVYTDHSAVKAVLETPSPSGKHAEWWSKIYRNGVKTVNIVYRAGRENISADRDALSRSPQLPAPIEGVAETDVQVAVIRKTNAPSSGVDSALDPQQLNTEELLEKEPSSEVSAKPDEFGTQQQMDPQVDEMYQFLQHGKLPSDEQRARKITAQGSAFGLLDEILYYLDSKHGNRRRAVVPRQRRDQIIAENHSWADGRALWCLWETQRGC